MVAALRAWQNFNDLESYDPTMMFPRTPEQITDPNHNLFWSSYSQTNLTKLFGMYAEHLSRFLFSFSMTIDTIPLFSSDDEKKQFFTDYQCDGTTPVVPLSWEDLLVNLNKVNSVHKNTVYDIDAYNGIVQLQKLFTWNLFDCFGDGFTPTTCGWISRDDMTLMVAPIMDVFGTKTSGLIDIVMLYLVLVKKAWRTVCVDGMPKMFVYNHLNRYLLTRNNQPPKNDDLTPVVGERFFRFFLSLNEKLLGLSARDTHQRTDVITCIVRAQDQKIKELAASTKRVEYTNHYTWT